MAAVPTTPAADPQPDITHAEAFIDFQSVFLRYGQDDSFAVEDITLKLRRHEFAAIVGPSGCGKSTFMKLTTGLKLPTQGTVIDATLLPWRTTLDNVLLPLEIVEPYRSSFKQKKDEYVERARALLATVGLAGNEDKYPWQLSGGMQQRASICRALVHQPKLLMLDEPFGALDAFTREELWCVLRDLWASDPFNVVLVTHDLREATFLADTVFVMSNRPGRILMRKEIDLPRPRDLEVTYSERFSEIVHELREKIGAIRKS